MQLKCRDSFHAICRMTEASLISALSSEGQNEGVTESVEDDEAPAADAKSKRLECDSSCQSGWTRRIYTRARKHEKGTRWLFE